MATPVHVKGHPIEPCPHTHIVIWRGYSMKLQTVKKLFLISSLALVTILSLWGYMHSINSYSLAWKIVTPIIANIAGITAFFSYIALALNYNIAPSGFYMTLKAS